MVLCELYRGTRDRAAEMALDGLVRSSAEIWSPLSEDWLKAGRLIRAIGDDGALVLTGDIADFRLIKRRVDIEVQEV